MKKKAVKIIVPILALLMLLAMASSAKACLFSPPSKTPITVAITGLTSISYSTLKYVVHDDIEYLLYFTFSGTIAIFAGTFSYATLPSTPLTTVDFVDVCWGTYNIATNTGSYTFYEVWTISNGATFVGFDHPHSTGDLLSYLGVNTGNPPWSAVEAHMVVVGTGAYAGQVIDVASPNLLASPCTGYWLTP